MKTLLYGMLLIALLVLVLILPRTDIPMLVKEAFANPVTEGQIAPICPPGFKFFTDRDGKSMCCNGKIDFTEGRCYKQTGKNAIHLNTCTLGSAYVNEFGEEVPYCGSMMQKLLAEISARDCTTDKPYRATADGITGFCCAAAPASATPNTCPAESKSCVVIPVDSNPFAQSNSCALEQITDQAKCPLDMQRITLVPQTGEVAGLSVPFCMTNVMPRSGTPPYCIPDNVINSLRKHGVYRNKDLNKWIGTCKNYFKVNIEKSVTKENADLSGF